MYQSQPFFAPAFFDKFSLEKNYFGLLFFHLALGVFFFHYPKMASFYGIAIALIGLGYVIFNKNKNHEILQVAGYLIGMEVFIRMTGGFLNYEFTKYSLIVFTVLGLIYSGFSIKAIPYWIYILALTPSVIFQNNIDIASRDIVRGIIFNLLGPICLGIIAIYCYEKKITINVLNKVLICVGLPILTCAIYVLAYSPEIRVHLRGVSSNLMFSGGFGPNQVAATLGLGMFVFFVQFILNSTTKIRFFVNYLIFALLCYLCLLTFSRGGMITGCLVCIVFLISIYCNSKSYGKALVKKGFVYLFFVLIAVFTLISYQTNGLIGKRYTNRNHLGVIMKDKYTDRKEIAKAEINLFIKNPILGIGAGQGTQLNKVKYGRKIKSHDELTRLLAEHGLFGLLNILILTLTPIFLFLKSKENIFLFSFLVFWFLTINHSGMRIAAPAFLYALMLLKINTNDEPFFNRLRAAEN